MAICSVHIVWFYPHFRHIFDKCSLKCRPNSKHSVSACHSFDSIETFRFSHWIFIVFLKNVTKQTLEDLIAFIYCGNVNVKQENLHEFLSTAKALNIKGLADDGYTHSVNIPLSNFNFTTSSYNGLQYQSTRTIPVPEQVKPNPYEPSHYEIPVNAVLENENSGIHNGNGNGYDDDDYIWSDGDSTAMDHLSYGAEVEPAKPKSKAKRTKTDTGEFVFFLFLYVWHVRITKIMDSMFQCRYIGLRHCRRYSNDSQRQREFVYWWSEVYSSQSAKQPRTTAMGMHKEKQY